MWRAPWSAVNSLATSRWILRHPLTMCRAAASSSAAAAASAARGRQEPEDKVVLAARKMLEATDSSWSAMDIAKRGKSLGGLKSTVLEYEDARKLALELEAISDRDPDADLRAIAAADLSTVLSETLPSLLSRMRSCLLPIPPSHAGPALLEVRLAVGGAESAHFAADLLDMYLRLCARRGWRATVVSRDDMMSGQGRDGLREAAVEVEGEGVYGGLRWEAGVHRVQRVPVLQNTSSVHTSTASVLVLPLQSDDPADEGGDLYDDKDVRVDTMRAGGAGGQHVNKTESAIRLTHVPTGITVSMQDSRSQAQNRTKAFTILRARLLDRRAQETAAAESAARRAQVRTGQRSEKIRTYNFQQGRVTDHRVGLTFPRLADALDGGETLDLFATALDEQDDESRLDAILDGDVEL